MTMWLFVWGRNQTWGMGNHMRALFDRECSACLTKEISWKATFEAEWMTLRTSLCLFNRMLFLLQTPPLHPSYPPPMPPPATHTLTLVLGQWKGNFTSHSLPLQTLPSWFVFLPETWSAWNNIKGIVLLWSFPEVSLSPSFSPLSMSLCSSSPPPPPSFFL